MDPLWRTLWVGVGIEPGVLPPFAPKDGTRYTDASYDLESRKWDSMYLEEDRDLLNVIIPNYALDPAPFSDLGGLVMANIDYHYQITPYRTTLLDSSLTPTVMPIWPIFHQAGFRPAISSRALFLDVSPGVVEYFQYRIPNLYSFHVSTNPNISTLDMRRTELVRRKVDDFVPWYVGEYKDSLADYLVGRVLDDEFIRIVGSGIMREGSGVVAGCCQGDAYLVWLLSKMFDRTTIIQPFTTNEVYVVALGYKGDLKAVDLLDVEKPQVPVDFEQWWGDQWECINSFTRDVQGQIEEVRSGGKVELPIYDLENLKARFRLI